MEQNDTVFQAIAGLGERPGVGFTFVDAQLQASELPWAELAAQAQLRACRWLELGLQPGSHVGLVVGGAHQFVTGFAGAILAGLVPVPLMGPPSVGEPHAYMSRLQPILEASGAVCLVVPVELKQVAAALKDAVGSLGHVLDYAHLARGGAASQPLQPPQPQDVCFVQFTSGSTGTPRGVAVTHQNLVANICAAAEHTRSDPGQDIGLAWVPLYHDLGLIGSVIGPLLTGIPQVLVATEAFAMRPAVWLQLVDRYRATMTSSSNFGLRMAAKRRRRAAQLDLSCLRVILVGSEPISAQVLRDFQAAYGPAGLAPGALCPAYGLAESTLAVTVHAPGRRFETAALALVDEGSDPDAMAAAPQRAREVVCCGRPLPRHEVGIHARTGAPLGEGHEGEIWVRGPSVTPGYLGGPRHSGWLRTGDLGLLRDGQLYVTGRLKDLIIVAGRNYAPQEVEACAGEVDGLRAGHVVAFALGGEGVERLVIVAECSNPQRVAHVALAVRRHVQVNIGLTASDVCLIQPFTLQRTSSGKLRRGSTRLAYQRGQLQVVHALRSEAPNASAQPQE